jgi:hypothetical protein
MDLSYYPAINFDKNLRTAHFQIEIINRDKKHYITAVVNKLENSNEITLFLISENKSTNLFSIIDTKLSDSDLSYFKREYYEDGKLRLTNIYESSILKCSAKPLNLTHITKLNADKKINLSKICTLDIETRMDPKTKHLIPICMSFFIKNKTYSFIFTAN